jgi:hypothetical protein
MDANKPLTEIFLEVVKPVLTRHRRLSHALTMHEQGLRAELLIHKKNDQGFDVGVLCEPHGVYPWAGNWRGAVWDATMPHAEGNMRQTCENCLGFIRTLLSPDARLRVKSKSGQPCQWTVELFDGKDWHAQEESSLAIYNYFGALTEETFQNNHFRSRRRSPLETDQFWYALWVD